jgi:hypothetical protein
MAGLWPTRDSALGCAGHQRASARPTTGVRTTQPSGGQKRGTRRRGGTAALTFPAHDGAARWLAHRDVARRRRAQGQGWSRSYELSRASSCATCLACGLAQGAPWCVATAVLAHARPRHARSAQSSGVQRRSTRRGGGATTIPCTKFHGSMASSIQDPRTVTAVLKGMSGPGAPSCRGAVVLRRDGRHTGKVNRMMRLDVTGASQE